MNLEEIRSFIEQNKDNQEVQGFLSELRGTPSIDEIQRLANENDDIRTWLQSEKDRHFSKGLETWKAKTMPGLIEEEIRKRYPEETPEQIEIKKLRAEIEQERRERKLATNRAKAKDIASKKELPADLVDFFVSADESTTLEAIEQFEKAWSAAINKAVEGRFKDNAREPVRSHLPARNNPFAKETFNLTEQARLWKENPELARQYQELAKRGE